MSEIKKRIFDALGRVAKVVTADLFERTIGKKTPGLTVTQTRKTLTNTTTKKRTKGE